MRSDNRPRCSSTSKCQQQQQQQLQREILAEKVAIAVNNWELGISAIGPSLCGEKSRCSVHDDGSRPEYGPPKSPENGVQIAQEAYRRVNEQYKAWTQPQRQATSRVPSSTGRTAGVAPEPKSLLEAVRFAREGAPRL